MALIACPDCSTSVSDQAALCPNCACPIRSNAGVSPKVAPFILGLVAVLAGIVVWFTGGDWALAAGLFVGGLFVVAANTRSDNTEVPAGGASALPLAPGGITKASPAVQTDMAKARRHLLLFGLAVLVVYLYVALFVS